MKKFTSIILGLVLLSTVAIAVEALTLKGNMKQAGNLLKQVTASVNDSTKNQVNAKATADMTAFIVAARDQAPDMGSFDEYKSIMDQEIAALNELKAAFEKNDNVAAQAALQKVNLLKKEGHDKFK